MHESVSLLSQTFLLETRRRNYVTPTSYLELINTYKTLLHSKREEVNKLVRRYKGGLEALALAESSVNSLKEDLIAMQPGLRQAQEDTAVFAAKVGG
jgi:dynein heavy chain